MDQAADADRLARVASNNLGREVRSHGIRPRMLPAPFSSSRIVQKGGMDRMRFDRGWRAAALMVALFAVTLNAFQPLAHAAAMRASGPLFSFWAAMCLPGAADPNEDSGLPAASRTHECCLGLAHAVTLAAPLAAFTIISSISLAGNSRLVGTDVPAAGGIRDGPGQPRGPPLFE